jgi:hypothetical protein
VLVAGWRNLPSAAGLRFKGFTVWCVATALLLYGTRNWRCYCQEQMTRRTEEGTGTKNNETGVHWRTSNIMKYRNY